MRILIIHLNQFFCGKANMSVFKRDYVLYQDIDKHLTLKFVKKHNIATSLKEIKSILREAKTFQILRDDAEEATAVVPSVVPSLRLTECIKKLLEHSSMKVRNLENYCFFDPYAFSGIIIHKPKDFFDDVIYVGGNQRIGQTLVRYPQEIREYMQSGALFYYLGSTIGNKTVNGSGYNEESSVAHYDASYFSGLFTLRHKNKDVTHIFAVWEVE